MESNIQTFIQLVEQSNKILLLFPYIINSDVCASVGLTYKLLKNKYNKNIDIAASRNIPVRFHNLLKSCGVDVSKVLTEIKPVSYVIHVNDTNDKVNVAWQKSGEKIDVILTPDTTEIDFNKVSFSTEGGIYDLVITFNANRLEDLGRIYIDYKNLYAKYNVISIDYQSNKSDYAKLSLNDDTYSTVSEVLYELYKNLSLELDGDDANVLAEGVLGSTYGLHDVTKNKTYSVIADLVNKYKIDTSGIITKYFYSLNKNDLNLREKILRGVKFDDSRKVIYSTITLPDFAEIGLKPTDLDGMDYLPFNVCDGYEYAFLAYEDTGKTYVLLHSNKLSKDITPILKKINGYGNKYFGLAIITGSPANAVSQVLNAISGGTQTTPAPVKTQPVEQVETVSATQSKVNEQLPQETSSQIAPAPQPMPEVVSPATEEASPVTTSSPFQKAQDYVIDANAAPVKSTSGKPFDRA